MVAGRVCCCWVGAGAARAGTVGRVGAGRAEGLDWRGMFPCGVWLCGKGLVVSAVGGERGGSRWPDGMGDILPEGVASGRDFTIGHCAAGLPAGLGWKPIEARWAGPCWAGPAWPNAEFLHSGLGVSMLVFTTLVLQAHRWKG